MRKFLSDTQQEKETFTQVVKKEEEKKRNYNAF